MARVLLERERGSSILEARREAALLEDARLRIGAEEVAGEARSVVEGELPAAGADIEPHGRVELGVERGAGQRRAVADAELESTGGLERPSAARPG